MPSLDDFSIAIDNNQFIITETKPSATRTMQEAMALMLATFNLTNKLDTHRHSSLFLFLHDNHKDIFDLLNNAHLPVSIPSTDDDERAIKSFFSTRAMSYTTRDGTFRNNILLPFLDYLNHSNQSLSADALPLPANITSGVTIFYSPLPDSSECVFRYSFYDPLSSAFLSGFIEPTQTIVRSIPLTLALGEVTLAISRRKNTAAANDIPAIAKDLQLYFPALAIDEESGLPSLSQLTIPGASAPRSMRRILEIAIRNLVPHINDKSTIAAMVKTAEDAVLANNRALYQQLLENAEAIQVPQFKTLLQNTARQSLDIIDRYSEFTRPLPYAFLAY
jgi:hypothetical protein